MKIIFVLIYVSISNFAQATDWQSILSAQNPQDLLIVDSKNRRNERITENCKIEHKKSLFPRYCFLALESRLESPISQKALKREIKELNQVCIIRINQVHNLYIVDEVLENKFLNDLCRRTLLNHKSDLEYARF